MTVRLQLRLYVGLVALAALAVVLVLAVTDAGGGLDEPWLILPFAAVIALEHLFDTRIARSSEEGESYSHEESFLVAMAMVAPPLAVVLAFAAGFLAGGEEAALEAAARCVSSMGAFPP